MQLVVEAAGVADGLALAVAAPEGGGGGVAVGAGQTHAARSRLEWPILHLLTSASHPHRQQTSNSEIKQTNHKGCPDNKTTVNKTSEIIRAAQTSRHKQTITTSQIIRAAKTISHKQLRNHKGCPDNKTL